MYLCRISSKNKLIKVTATIMVMTMEQIEALKRIIAKRERNDSRRNIMLFSGMCSLLMGWLLGITTGNIPIAVLVCIVFYWNALIYSELVRANGD